MGGQACVFYGAAEFSRDLDLLILADAENLNLLRAALRDLEAEPIAVPTFEAKHLRRGHAVHFRCRREDVAGLRVDVMSTLRGVAGFEEVWQRRTTIEVDGEAIDLLALEDLVRAKRTQRDKYWPMLRRLVEQHYLEHDTDPSPARVAFWLRELRTPELLVRLAAAQPEQARSIAPERAAVHAAMTSDLDAVSAALINEEREERLRDQAYWEPLKREIAEFRRNRRN